MVNNFFEFNEAIIKEKTQKILTRLARLYRVIEDRYTIQFLELIQMLDAFFFDEEPKFDEMKIECLKSLFRLDLNYNFKTIIGLEQLLTDFHPQLGETQQGVEYQVFE